MEKKVDGSGEGWEAMARGRGRDGGWRHTQMREGLSFEISLRGRAFCRLRFFLSGVCDFRGKRAWQFSHRSHVVFCFTRE